ncbi:MAG TPA: uroporphyrinogen-III synthase [Steroidobacteraceae bacterium]|nr:uroporphyrinogen-III synthase [Steroidobacteraceae bacterium]
MKGRTVAILESRVGEHLADLIRKRGATVLHAPALAEVPDVDPQAIQALIGELRERPVRLAIFQTGVGTRALFATTDALRLTGELLALLAATRVAARGPKPTGVLTSRKVRIDFSADDPYTTREVLEAIAALDLKGQRVLVQRYGDANSDLNDALLGRGADVVEVTTYRWAIPADTAPLEHLIEELAGRGVDAVVVTSASQIFNLAQVARRAGRESELVAGLKHTFVASVGPVASRAIRGLGVEPAFEASPPKLGPLIAGLEDALTGAGVG